MKKSIIGLILFLNINFCFSQVEKNIYELNSQENLLTENVKEILDTNLKNKRVVFLGESNHYIGSDLAAKVEFVKYLVLNEGYKDIAFESDFFALYYDHRKENLYEFWSNSEQCKKMFTFLEEHNVTIWGFDAQMYFPFTVKNFSVKLNDFLIENKIIVDKNFINLTDKFYKNRRKADEIIGKSNLELLKQEIDNLLKSDKVIQNKLWFQLLENYKNAILLSSKDIKANIGVPIRDAQMAKNLDFLVKSMPEKKFIVWLANAHMIKDNYATFPGQTMGFQFENLNPNISYYIAISSINMPYRKPKVIKKYSEDKDNLLNLLPSIENNYFIDSKKLIGENSDFKTKEFYGMFSSEDKPIKTNWLNHFDALVFISKGEEVKFIK